MRTAKPTKATRRTKPARGPKVESGKRYTLLYPLHPFHCIPSPLVPYFITVDGVRDLTKDQLEPEEVTANPLAYRSRYCILGTDVATGAKVGFYHAWVIALHEVTADPSLPWDNDLWENDDDFED